jgi:hypothetical protein
MSDTQTTDAPVTDGQAPKAPVRRARATTSSATQPTGAAATAATRLLIKPVETETLLIHVIGTAPLIVSRFSEKAKKQMLDAQLGIKNPPAKRDPESEFLASLYKAGLVDPDGPQGLWLPRDPDEAEDAERVINENQLWGLPSMAFKMATIGAGRFYGKAVKMTELRQFMFFNGINVPGEAGRMVVIKGIPEQREDYVRLAGVNHPADLRYRGCFYEWEADLEVRYTKNLLDRTSLISLIDAGGMGVGVGEWRPERNGEFGTFQVDDSPGGIKVVRNAAPLVIDDEHPV